MYRVQRTWRSLQTRHCRVWVPRRKPGPVLGFAPGPG